MRLLVVSTWTPHPDGNGAEQRAFHMARALAARHAVRLIAFMPPDSAPDPPALGLGFDTVDLVRESPFVEGPFTREGLFSHTPRSLVQAYRPAVGALVSQRAADCDLAIGFGTPVVAYIREVPLPRIFEEIEVGSLLNGTTSAASWRERLRRTLTWWKAGAYFRGLVRHSVATSVVSTVERAHLLDMGCAADRLVVIPNGIDIAAPSVAVPVEPATMVYPGSITFAANLDAMQYFIRTALPLVRRARPAAMLTITGSVDAASRAALPAAHGVVLTGRLPDVGTAIARSRAAIVPLRRGGGTRLKILHAMAVGTPVVSTSKGIEGLDLIPGRDLLVADTPGAFADSVIRLFDDDDLHARLSARGREIAAGRSWRVSGRILCDLVETRAAGR